MNGKDSALFSKASDEWSTPQWLFDQINREFHIECDEAATGKIQNVNGISERIIQVKKKIQL